MDTGIHSRYNLAVIEVHELTRRYGELTAVDGLTFTVAKGEILGLLGPNGAGKTSTLRMITGFLPPSDGRVTVDGQDVFEAPLAARSRIGYLPETPPVYPDLTVAEQLAFCAALRGVPRQERKKEVELAAERAGLKDVLKRSVGVLSKGFRQRVGLAGALVGRPPVLILDEPTVGLDPGQILEVRALVQSLAEEHTVILSTHILTEVSHVCHKVLVLRSGRQVAFDTLEGLAESHGQDGQSLEAIFLALTAPDVEAEAEAG